MFKSYRFFLIFVVFVCGYYIFGYNKKNIEVAPINLTKKNVCVYDSMILIYYNGPKAQILWNDGSRSFYCEVREAFYDSLDTLKNKRIKAFFVQDFSELTWGSYTDKWVSAHNAYYVIDSNKDGAMGVTYVPFTNLTSAKKFLKSYGGILLKFSEINFDTLSVSADLLKNRVIY